MNVAKGENFMDISALLQKYDRPVPRYTSYPTAVHFNHEVMQKDYADLLAGLPQEDPVSLYIHIPFCHILCHYCGCHTKVANNYSPVQGYVQTLLEEIDLVGKKLSQPISVSKIHFGGGSPNFLQRDDLEKIMDSLACYFNICDDSEIVMETDPRLMDKDKIQALADSGFTRISLGVQDFNANVQKATNRIQPFETVERTTLDLRSASIQKINFDLMIGLPLQTLDIVRESALQAISLAPNRLAVFAYAHVPWMKKHQKLLEKYEMPDTKMRFDMMVCVKETLESAGYHAIGIDHFAREDDSLYQSLKSGTLRRNFQGYTDDQAKNIIGFGLSSISSFEGAYVQNTTDAPEYRRAINAGEFPITRGCVLSDEDKNRRAVIEQIMCGYKTDISDYPESRDALVALAQDGLIEMDGFFIQLTSSGWPFARMVAVCFDTYFIQQESQHARAI